MKAAANPRPGFSASPRAVNAAAIVIVGGAGFIGSNLADHYLSQGRKVIVLDNLSRPGVIDNLRWLQGRHGDLVRPIVEDIRDPVAIRSAFENACAVYHFAAQTAVTTSLAKPREDFEINALGTVNVLETVREVAPEAPVIFASTNKVYGNLTELELQQIGDRYMPLDQATSRSGIGEDQKLDFCTPYGCSKGVADQYVLDYSKSYGLRTAVLRMSCIYGPRQFGTEDQGWVAHFLIRALRGELISVYGDGRQVRDVLHVSDAVTAYSTLLEKIDLAQGRAYNLGGGPENAVSIQIVLREIEALTGKSLQVEYGDWRAGDQLYFVADTRRIQHALGWAAKVGWRDGLRNLHDWLVDSDIVRLAGARQRVSA